MTSKTAAIPSILDSFTTLNIAAFLDETFKTQIEPSEINPENFRSVASLAARLH